MTKISLEKIITNPDQPRHDFADLESLAESIRSHGLINPIAVEEAGDLYILIDGERRWRAAKMAGLREIEVHIKPALNGGGQQERLLLAMIANLQRSDLNPMEEARAYREMSNLGMTQTRIAAAVGYSVATINSRMSLLTFPPEIQAIWESGKLSTDLRVMAALRRLPDDETRVRLAQGFARRGTSIPFITIVCARLAGRIQQIDNPLVNKNDSPAMQLAEKQAKNRGNIGHWNAFTQAKITPPWSRLNQAVVLTCKNCILVDMASESSCKDCPLVDLIKFLMEEKHA